MPKRTATVLTDRAIRSFTAKLPKAGMLYRFDAQVSGLSIRTRHDQKAKGVGSWVYFYRIDGKQRGLTLGRFPALSLADARNEAAECRGWLDRGLDPKAERKQRADGAGDLRKKTFSSVTAIYVKKRQYLKTINRIEQIFDKYFADWSDTPIHHITRLEVIAAGERIADKNGGPMANRAIATLKGFFSWCLDEGHIETSPCIRVKQPAPRNKRQRVLTVSELRKIWPACDELGYPFGAAAKVMLVTGQRKGEVSTLRWESLDLERGTWTLESNQTKSGRRNELPLPDLAVEVLESMPRVDETYVFSAFPGRHVNLTSWHDPQNRLRDLSETQYEDKAKVWTLHDMRRTMADTMYEHLGVAPDIIRACLNHAKNLGGALDNYTTTTPMDAKRIALRKWADWLKREVLEREVDNVVEFRRG